MPSNTMLFNSNSLCIANIYKRSFIASSQINVTVNCLYFPWSTVPSEDLCACCTGCSLLALGSAVTVVKMRCVGGHDDRSGQLLTILTFCPTLAAISTICTKYLETGPAHSHGHIGNLDILTCTTLL